jgi:hypothetical protein
VPFADQRADVVVVELRRRVGRDLGDPLRAVRDDVEALEALERVRVDQVGGAGPVVAHDEHVARRALGCGLCGRDQAHGDRGGNGSEQRGTHGRSPRGAVHRHRGT